MDDRVARLESLVQQVAAMALMERLGPDAATVTVTRVDAAPDMHNVTVWIGLLGAPEAQAVIWSRIVEERGEVQRRLAAQMTTKYVPQLHFKRDQGGEYAAGIERLLKGL